MTSITPCRCRRPIPGSTMRKVVEGFRVPDDRPPTKNELAWVEMLRLLVGDADPPPSLPSIQALRAVLTRE